MIKILMNCCLILVCVKSAVACDQSDVIAPFLENAGSFGSYDCTVKKRMIHHELEGRPKIVPWIEEWDMRLIIDRTTPGALYVVRHFKEKYDDDDRDFLECILYHWNEGKGTRLQYTGSNGFEEKIDFEHFFMKYTLPCMEYSGYSLLPTHAPTLFSDVRGQIEKQFESASVRILADGTRNILLANPKDESESTTIRLDRESYMPVFVSSNAGKKYDRGSFSFEVKFEKKNNVYRPVSSTGVHPSFKVKRKTGEVTHTIGNFVVDVVWHKFMEDSLEIPEVDRLRRKPIADWEAFIRNE